MNLGIVIPTYQKSNGKTPELLTRALSSIRNQTYQNYKVFLIGDKYDDDSEFVKLATHVIDSDRIFYENLPVAEERSKYQPNSRQLWCSGGVNATNYGMMKCLEEGIEFICHLDHDDYWEPNHLEVLADTIESLPQVRFLFTCSTFTGRKYLPLGTPIDGSRVYQRPVPCNIIHSSTCVNHKALRLNYRDMFSLKGTALEADIDMWNQVNTSTKDDECVLIRTITCHHPTERQ